VTEDGIDDRGNERGEDEVSREAHALGNGPGHERRGGPDESDLEQEVRGQEHAVAVEEEQRPADEPTLPGAEHQSEAEQPEE
jgi:hypothetical protein